MTAPAGHAGLPDADAIRRLVEEVVRRIQGEAAARPAGPSPAAGAGVSVGGTVISAATIAGLPAGTRRLTVAARAVITPSARDAAGAAGIAIVRGNDGAGASIARPFVVAHAACPGDAGARTAAIARAVPGSQQLPATGLADVIAAIAVHASRDAARAILLTGRPAAAVVLANRAAGLRAVTARDPRSLAAAAAECAANLLVVDPTAFGGGSLERSCAEFARLPAGSVPAELAGTPTPCSCKTHGH